MALWMVLWVCASGMAKQVKSTGVTLLICLLVLIASAFASQKCRTGCQGRTSPFQVNYVTGNTYVYNFEGHTIATLPGQQGDGTKLQLKATAEVSILDKCQGVLKLKDVQVTGPDSQKYSHLSDLEAHPVSFGYEKGIVDRELCTEEKDSEASVNIKRAVLSLLQVTPTEILKPGRSNVLDVFGLCPTDFSYSERGETTTITKTRNLNKCHLREHLRQDFAAVTYHIDSDLQTTPLLESTQEQRQQLKNGILNSAESHEKYLYRPFSNQEVGAKTTVDSKLVFISQSKQDAPKISGSNPRSIVFEPPHVGNTASSNVAAIKEALHKAHEAMPDHVDVTAAREFANVVTVLRQSNKDDILSVYSQVKAGAGFKAGTKMFLDALFRAGTGDSVEVAVELLKSKKISGPDADLYYVHLAYTKHVTLPALTAAVSLLDQPEFSKLAYLGVGALGGRYCAQHRCEEVPEFDDFLDKLSKPLGDDCKTSSWDDELKVVASLKALHNVHHLNDATAKKLRACALEEGLPTRVRVAALDVFQSDACRLKDTSLEILKNQQLDSELRIKAFLALVECPCHKSANALKEVLESEPTYQVGSFIASYLRNLRASTNPSKEKIKAVFGEVRPTKRFPLDFRKFSNNFEFSYLLGGLNLGSTVESNVIYSQRSFLPRSSTLNITTELFGHSVNLLELELRQENLDLIAERLFGPKGYFNTHNVREVIKDGKEKWTDLENNVKQRLNQAIRGKRSITKEALEEVRQKSVSPFHAEPDRELLLELSTRLFGAEVGWFTLHHNARDAGKELFDKTFDIVDKVVKKAKDFDYKLKQHNTFLDTELVYPTSLGFPLKLVASGSSAIHVDLQGKLDANELINDFKNSHVRLKFVPSAAIELVGEFVVDAYAVEAGLKVASTLHTATGADINVKAASGLGVDVTFGLPIKKQDVITLKSEVLTTVHERGKPEVDTAITFTDTKRRDYHGCFDQLSPLTGLTFCGTVSFPWDPAVTKSAFYPLNGPSNFSLTIETEDVTSYHFHASYNNEDTNKKSLQLLLETPDSKTDRKLGIILELTLRPFQGIKAQLNSPWKHLTGELTFTDSAKEITFLAKLLNDADEYSIKLGASVTGDPSHATYQPLLEYKTPQQKSSLVAQKGIKGKPEKLSQKYGVEGSVTVDKSTNSRKFTFNDVVLKTPNAQYKLDGTITDAVHAFSTDLKVTYGEEHVILKSDYKNPGPTEYHADILLFHSQYPDFGVNFIWDYKRDKNNLENSLVVVHGKDTDSKDARVTLHQQAQYRYDNIQNFEFSTKNAVSYPLLGIIGKLDGKVAHNSLHIDIEASYDKHKFESELSAKTGVKNPGDYEVEFEAKIQDNSIEFETKREVVSQDQSKFITKLGVKPGGKYELEADVTHHIQRDDVNFQVVAVARFHGQPNEYKLDSGLVLNKQLFDTHYKASVGNTDYFEVTAKYNRASGSPSGNAKVFLKDYLSGGGQFKYSDGKGSATFNVDIPKIDRKIKGTGDIQIIGSQNVVTVDIFYNAEKDLNQKIHFHTDTDLKKDAVSSKNTLVVLDYKTEFNVNGQLIDRLDDGQLKGEFDLSLPTGSHFTGKLDRTLHLRSTNSEGDVKLELTGQTSASNEPAKVTFEFAAKNVDTKQYSFDGQSKLAYYSPNGKDVAIVVAATNIPQREQRVIKAQAALQGSLISEPVRVEFNSDIHESYIAYKGHGSYGTTTTVDTSGKVSKTLQRHKNFYIGPFSLEGDFELKLPLENYKHIKETFAINGKIEENKIQASYNEEVIVDDSIYKISLELDNEIEKGNNKLTVTLPNHEPQTYTSNWYFNYNDFKTKELLKGGFSYSGNLITKLSVDVDGKKDLTDLNIHATLQSQHEKLKNVEFSLKNKYVQSPKLEAETDISLIVDDKKVTIDSKLTPGIIPGLPNIDFTATHPQGKSRIFLLLQSKSKNDVSGKAELEWTTNGGGKLTASGKANYESAQNFKIEVDVDSPALKLNKWHILLANKPAKSAKTLQIAVTEAEESIISGRLEYRVEDKENSYKAGVSGNVKVRDTTQPLKAEVSFKKFTPAENGELGTERSLTFHLGEVSYETLTKITNKETRYSSTFCSKKDTCSVTEAHSNVKVIDLTHIEHEFGAKVDLKAHGYPEGFVLEGRTVRLPLSFEHKSELKLLNEKRTTYKLHSYLNEKTVGVVVTLPQRVIAAEGKLGYVKEKGEHKLDLSFWLDKEKQPANKAGVYLLVAVNPTKDGTTLQGEVKLSHPDLQKDLSIISKATVLNHDTLLDATVDFDVFDKKNQKLTLTTKIVKNQVPAGFNITGFVSVKGKIADITLEGGAEVSTNGIGYNSILTYKNAQKKTRQAQVLFHLTLTEVLLYVKSPTADILKMERTITSLPDGQTSVEGEISVLGIQPINLEALLNIPVSNKHTIYRKNTPNRKLVIDILHDILTGFSFHATLTDGDQTKDILNVGVDLTDNNFLKTHFTWSASEIKSLVEHAKEDTENFLKQLKVVLHDAGEEVTSEIQDILEASKQAQPDVKGIISSYKNQLNILKEELENDEGFTGASENVKKLVKAFTTVVETFVKTVTQLVDGVLADLIKIRNGVQELLNKLLPKLKELYTKVLNLLSAVSNAALENVSKIILKLVDVVKEHEGEIKKIAQIVQEFIEDIGKTVGTTIVQIRNEVSGFVRIVLEQVKSIPIVSNFKEYLKNFVSQLPQYLLPEQAWPVIKDVLGGVKDTAPTEELRELISAVQEYVDKIVAKQSVNDIEELQLILKKAIKALKSLLTLVHKQLPAPATTDRTSFLGFRLPFVLSTAIGFPKLVDLKFSPLLFLTSGGLTDLPRLKEIIHTYRPTLNPLEWLPPYRAEGVLIDAEHFITLDGRHFTFKGTCAYVLLQDVVDGNFSVAIDYASKSIVVSDQHDSVEFFHDSKFKANGQPAEYPFASGDIVAWKDFESVNVKHKAGLFVTCKTGYRICLFYVSGFYFGKTRGLLGALDYEPWDDFKEPNGQVVSKVNDFGNSWKVNPSCADVSGVTHHEHDVPEPPECTHIFGGATPLRLGYFFVPSAPFREACSHIVADAATPEAKKEAACTTAAAYVALLRSRYIIVSLPSDCVHCSALSGPSVEAGDSVSVKVPQKSADIVIVVEQDLQNSEIFKDLITPLVTTLTADLKIKGITDVHFTLIGFGEATYSYPAVYTTNGKTVFEGKTKNIKFTEHVDPFSLKLDTCENKFKYLMAFLKSELGLAPATRAFNLASRYPFKIGSSKVLVGVVSTAKTSAFSVSLQQLAALYSVKVLRDRGVAFHVVIPVDDLGLTNKDATTVKKIVGFDSDHVYLVTDAKKKALEGSTELHQALTYKNNIWIPIALDSYGATYIAQNFIDAKSSVRKQFLQVFSRRIAESLETELHEDCTCNVLSGIYPFSDCKVTSRKEREPLAQIKASKGGVKG